MFENILDKISHDNAQSFLTNQNQNNQFHTRDLIDLTSKTIYFSTS